MPDPVRTRWVDYKVHDFDAAQIEPGWHAWMSYAVDKAPSQDPSLAYKRRAWEDTDYKTIPNYTQTRGAYKPYNTYAAQPPRQLVCKETETELTFFVQGQAEAHRMGARCRTQTVSRDQEEAIPCIYYARNLAFAASIRTLAAFLQQSMIIFNKQSS